MKLHVRVHIGRWFCLYRLWCVNGDVCTRMTVNASLLGYMVTRLWPYVQVTLFKQSVEDELAAYRLGYDAMNMFANANLRIHYLKTFSATISVCSTQFHPRLHLTPSAPSCIPTGSCHLYPINSIGYGGVHNNFIEALDWLGGDEQTMFVRPFLFIAPPALTPALTFAQSPQFRVSVVCLPAASETVQSTAQTRHGGGQGGRG